MRIFEKSKHPETLSAKQQSVLTGLMLGDGSLYRDLKRCANTQLSTKRNILDHNYNLWLADIFYNMLPPKPIYYQTAYDKRTKKTYEMSGFHTKNCVVLNNYRSLWYPSRIKTVPKNIVLDSLSIAVWLCDDGHFRFSTKTNSSIKTSFATDGFDKEEVFLLASLLTDRYNERFTISCRSKNDTYTIHAADKASRTMISDIENVFPNGMDRKRIWINSKPSKQLESDI